MKKILFIICFFPCLLGYSQTNKLVTPELINAFVAGVGNGQLGLLTNEDVELISSPTAIIFTDAKVFYVLDNVNQRLVSYTKNFTQVNEIKNINSGLSVFTLDSDFIIGSRNMIGPDMSKESFYYDRTNINTKPISFNFSSFLKRYEEFFFICRIQNIFFFQTYNSLYFGFKISEGNDKTALQYLDNSALQDEFKKIKDTRYSWDGYNLFDHEQFISKSNNIVIKFFQGLPKTDFQKYSYIFDQRIVPLPNERYFFTGSRQVYFIDKDGLFLNTGQIPNDESFYPTSQFAPAPDGYVYYLHADFKKKVTNLYRIGPFPELALGYGGTSGTVNDDRVNIRERASTKGVVIKQAEKMTPVRILEKTDKSETIAGQTSVWYKVRLWDRTEGWIFGAFIDIAK